MDKLLSVKEARTGEITHHTSFNLKMLSWITSFRKTSFTPQASSRTDLMSSGSAVAKVTSPVTAA